MRFGSHYKEIVFLVANEKKGGKKKTSYVMHSYRPKELNAQLI